MKRRMLVSAAVLAAVVSVPLAAVAQRVEHGRGNVVSIDKDRQTIQLKDPQGRVGTWKYNRNATVKFTDGAPFFPNPSVSDLRPPMYVHFTFSNEIIDAFDVVELGFQPGNEGASGSGAGAGVSSRKTPGTPRTVTGRVTAYDPNVRQVELDINGRLETFQLTDRSDQRFNPGDRVELKTDWSGQTELVSDARVLGRGTSTSGSNSGVFGGTSRNSAGTQSSGQSAEGRVVRITPRGVVMQVAGGQQNYGVDDASLLRRLRVGDTVQFDWRTDRNGRMFITNVR